MNDEIAFEEMGVYI